MKNNYRVIGDEVIIEVNCKDKILEVTIDLIDLEKVSATHLAWFMSGGYICIQPYIDGKRTTIRLHRLIMDPPNNLLCDHIDRNTLNNKRSNLRNVTEEINLKNKGIYRNTKSGIKGVCFDKRTQKWRATVSGLGKGKQLHLGSFNTKEDAEQAISAYIQQG